MTQADEQTQRQLERIREEAGKLPQGDREHPAEPDIPPDRTRRFTHVNFSRMRTEWKPEDKIKLQEVGRLADVALARAFPEAVWLLERLYGIVREKLVTSDGVVVKDTAGRTRWKRDENGFMIEHWDRLGDAQREEILDELTVHLVEWAQQAAVMWGSAMFAKGIWEEKFAWGYTTYEAPGRKTIDDRTQAGHLASMEERYFSIFQSMLSRRADALVRSLERLYDRLMKQSS
jgi:YD repeat-containing protein